MCQLYTISQPRLVAKPDIVESSVSDETMTDISGSIGSALSDGSSFRIKPFGGVSIGLSFLSHP